MNNKSEGMINFLAAFFVLMSAMVDPRISAGIAIVFLVGSAIFKLVRKV